MKRKEFFKVFLIFVFSSFFSVILSIVANKVLSYEPSFPYAKQKLPGYDLPQFLYSFANFDGIHYLTIAEKGYLGTALIAAFFPIYPILIRFFNYFFHNQLLSALILSQIFSFTSLLSFYYLVKNDYQKKVATIGTILLATFLSSFYFKAVYNEGLFLTLIFTLLIAAKKDKNILAVFLAALASATRIVGIFILPTLVILDWQKREKLDWKKIILYSFSSLGLLGYMFYLQKNFHDPLYFFHVQNEFGASRQTTLVIFPQVVWRYIKILWTARPFDTKYYAYLQEFLVSLWALFILVKASIKTYKKEIKLEWAYLVFAFGAYFLPTLTGNLSSMPRYIIVCFPIFIYLSQNWQKNKNKWPKILYLTINLVLLIINTILFIQGYWVA